MSLELRRGKSKWWYGRVKSNGRRFAKNLGVQVRGTIPASLSDLGDIAFERSRAKAQAALETFQYDLKRRSTAEELVQTIHEIRTGARVSSVPLDDIVTRWKDLPRRRPLSDSYSQTLKLLSPGDRVWVKIPGKGYVGVGRVNETVQSVNDFTLQMPSGDRPALDILSNALKLLGGALDAERAEYFVRVDWLDTVAEDEAFS